MLSPSVGPDGIVFDKEKQAVRLQYADNIDLQKRWMMAVWIKGFAGVPSPRNETLVTQARYDNRNETPHQFAFGLMSNPQAAAKVGFRFSAFLYNATSGKYQYVDYYYQNKLDVQDGWFLIVVGIDNVLDPDKVTLYLKIKNTAVNSREYQTYDFPTGLTWVQRQQDKQDIYLGGFCDLFSVNKVYGNPFRGTISRMWIWRDIQIDGLMGDFFLDRYFFRVASSLASPTCTDGVYTGDIAGTVPCRMCVVGFNPPTSLTAATTLGCLSEEKTLKQMFIANWDFTFNDPSSQQYIDDKTGNGYVMYKGSPIDAEPNEPFKISLQGYLFEVNMYTTGALPILLHNYPGFTFDVWIRRESPPPASATNTNAFAFLIDKTVASVYSIDFGIQVSDTSQKIIVTMNNVAQNSPTYSNILKDNTWQYFAVSIYRFQVGATKGCRLRFMANVEGLNSVITCVAFTGFTVTSANQMTLVSYRNFIFNRVRIWQHAMSFDEIPMMVKTSAANNCVKKLGQAPCTICPEDGKCQTLCNQNQFENPTNETCDSCHPFCGGCYKAGKDGCNFCTRSTSSVVYYNQQYGNCTCKSGLYYNITTDTCESCFSSCKECYGPTYLDCLTCNTGKIFYPPTYCVDNCDDPIVKGDGLYGYFMATEAIAGAGNFDMCIKCHPYCTSCYGTQNGECTACQDGFFLQDSSCIDNCPDFQYPDMVLKACAPCHSDCLKCSSPLQTRCTKCYEPVDGSGNPIQKKYLQGGTCKNQCDAGFYPDTEQVCQPCHVACGTCTSPRNTTCGSCTSGYFLEWLGFACKFDCVDGKYGDSATNMCLLCHYSCMTCRGAGPDQCTVCAEGYLRRKSLCVSKCEEGEFIVEGTCMSCDKKCLTCYGPSDDQCYTCADNTATGLGYYYYNFKCTSDCPDGYYPDNFEKVCKSCKTVCSACTSWDFCTSCIEGPYQLNNGECTFFQCMESQYRAVKPTLACYDCDPSCLTCQGMSRFDCLTCKPAYKFQDQTCLTCKDQPGMTESPDPTFAGCIEICGDGFNFGMYECDDGNLANGDGCNSKCLIEKGWTCSGGSFLMPDTCRDIQSPTPKISLINKQNQIYISFDEEVRLTEDLYNMDDPRFTLTVAGTQPSYKFDWAVQSGIEVGSHLQNIIINLKFYQSLRGTEKVSLKFLNAYTFQDASENGIVQVPLVGFLSAFEFHDPFWSNFLDGIASYIIAVFGLLLTTNIVMAQYLGVSTTALWTLICYLQMITLVPLMDVNWPDFVDTFFGKLSQSLNFEFSAIPNIIYDNMIAPPGTKTKIEPPLNARYSSFNYEYSNIFYLTGRKMVLWLGLIFTYPVIWYLKRNYADKHKFCKLWEKLESRYRYTFFLRGIQVTYLSMILASTLNIYKMQFINMETTISCFVSIAFQISMIYLPILIMNILQRNYDKLTHPKFLAQYNTVVTDLDLSHPSKYMYYAVFLMRRIIYVFMLVLFSDKTNIAVIAHAVVAVFVILYILIGKPFLRKTLSVLTIMGELGIVAFHAVGLGVTDPDQPDAENQQFGFLIVIILAVFLLCGLLLVVIQIISDCVTECKSSGQKDQAARLKEQEDTKYKKWKKRRQLVKREIALKEKQKLLDQHEDLVNQYRKQQEKEEKRKAKEAKEERRKKRQQEEEEERANAEEEYGEDGAPDYGQEYGHEPDESRAYMQDQSAFMMNPYQSDPYGGYQSQQVEDQMYKIQQKHQSPHNDYQVTEEQGYSPEPLNLASRNEGLGLQLNKNSGASSNEALQLQQHLQEQVEEFYGEENAYGDENALEVVEQNPDGEAQEIADEPIEEMPDFQPANFDEGGEEQQQDDSSRPLEVDEAAIDEDNWG